jgi:hypothetical protein
MNLARQKVLNLGKLNFVNICAMYIQTHRKIRVALRLTRTIQIEFEFNDVYCLDVSDKLQLSTNVSYGTGAQKTLGQKLKICSIYVQYLYTACLQGNLVTGM